MSGPTENPPPARVGVIGHDANPGMTNNAIKTSKYNIFTLIPKNLFEQFRRVANVYFLIQSVLMLIGTYFPQVFQSPVTPWSTLGTLMVVMTVTLVKDGVEDAARHRSDRRENNQPVSVIRDGAVKSILKKNVCVGDLLVVNNRQQMPADIVVLSSCGNQEQCYVETSNIDGETNLKIRRVPGGLEKTFPDLASFVEAPPVGTFECDAPNHHVHSFNGTIRLEGQQPIPASISNLLIRGSVLRNTKTVVGLVVYTGFDTKIMKNMRKVPSKLSSIERIVNKTIKIVFFNLFLLVIASVLLQTLYFESQTSIEHYYLHSSGTTTLLPDWLASMFTFFILYNNMVPISLYVTLEMVNLAQGYFVGQDLKMYDAASDVRAVCRDSSLCQEIGQVEYVFSDKTGTLTQNIMKLKTLSVNGKIYRIPDPNDPTSLFDDSDAKLWTEADMVVPEVLELFRHMSVCHTVIPEAQDEDAGSSVADVSITIADGVHAHSSDRKVVYQADSPDEAALVEAAADCGVQFLERKQGCTFVSETFGGSKMRKYTLLGENKFNSTRKRMSVVVRTPEGKILVLCKGADNVVIDRCKFPPGHRELDALNKHLSAFSMQGLRTLVFAVRELSPAEYEAWAAKYREASEAVAKRKQLLEEAAEAVERNMTLVGATGVEDKLQDGVPEAISQLCKAGIKLWVLTGDKVETAINIGKSCNVIKDDTILVTLIGGEDAVAEGLGQMMDKIDKIPTDRKFTSRLMRRFGRRKRSPKRSPSKLETVNEEPDIVVKVATSDVAGDQRADHGNTTPNASDSDFSVTESVVSQIDPNTLQSSHLVLVVDGDALHTIMDSPDLVAKLLRVSKFCSSVVACRVSPKQKANVVAMVKGGSKVAPVTLAIGDGANDVTMIQEAHLGIGISGREGRQAVNSSDFAIGQFRFLTRLLLVHGKWNYRRMTKVILVCFYKNIALVTTLFLYNLFTRMSGTSLYDAWIYSGFNFFTGMPPVMIGMFDKETSVRQLRNRPEYYLTGQKHMHLNRKRMSVWVTRALLHAVFIMMMACAAYSVFVGADSTWPSNSNGLLSFGMVVYAALIFVVMMAIAMETSTWNPYVVFFFGGSVLLFYLVALILSNMSVYTSLYGVFNNTMSVGLAWLFPVLLTGLCLLVDIVIRGGKIKLNPSKYEEWKHADEKDPVLMKSNASSAASLGTSKSHLDPVAKVQVASSSSGDLTQVPKECVEDFPKKNLRMKQSSFVDSSPMELLIDEDDVTLLTTA